MRKKPDMPNRAITKDQKLSRARKLINAIRSYALSPAFNVIALVLLFVSVISGLRFMSAGHVQSQIKFIENAGVETVENVSAKYQSVGAPNIFGGEVYDTSIRLRETGALGMAISLAVFNKSAADGNAPTNLSEIWQFIIDRDLLPPNLKFENSELHSPSSLFVVRFQSQPLRFEILSLPNQTNKSPAILMRFPIISLNGRTITYFQSASIDRFEMPEPFAPMQSVVASGWTVEQWRGEILPKPENPMQILSEEGQLLKESQPKP